MWLKSESTARHVFGSILLGGALMTGAVTGESAELEEVIVTAQRKAESLQDVPIAISALSEEIIEKTGTHDLAGIALQVPGLTFSAFSPGQNIVSLRGASSNDDGAGTDSSVAVFVDDVYLGRISNINPEMFDLERVEVLRGPQGTLYGKNTIGGAINIVSTKPNIEQFESKVKVGVGNYNRTDVAGLVTGPINDNLAFKFAASARARDGWANNPVLNKKQKDDNARGLRAQLLYSDDTTEVLFGFDYNDLDVEDMGRVPLRPNYKGIGPGGPNPAAFRVPYQATCGDVTGGKCVAGPIDGYARRESFGVSNKVTWSPKETLEVISITAYRESVADWNMDSTGGGLPINDDIFDISTQFSQEFRFLGSPNDRLNYVVGLWYLQEETDRTECFDLNGAAHASRATTPAVPGGTASSVAGTDCTPLTDGSEGYQQINKTESYAAFGQVDLYITPQLKLILGGRYSYEEKEIVSSAVTNARVGTGTLDACNSRSSPPTTSGLCIIAQNLAPLGIRRSWDAFTPRVSLSYEISDAMNAYLTYARGFKSGGFPAAPQTQEDGRRVLSQEEADNYEFGFKGLFGGVLRLSAAVFHTQYTGLQLQNFGTPTGQTGAFGRFLTFNAGDAKVTGLEVEATGLIGNNLTVTAFFSYNNSEFGVTNIANAAASANQQGNDLLRTPEWKYGVNVDYLLPLPGGSALNFGGNYNYSGDQRGDLPSYAVQPAFRLLDLRFSWITASEDLELTAWVKNATNEEYVSHIYGIAGGSVTAVYGDPIMYGLSATYRF